MQDDFPRARVFTPMAKMEDLKQSIARKVERVVEQLYQGLDSAEIVAMSRLAANTLKLSLNNSNPSAIQDALRIERGGMGANVEGRLQDILEMNSMVSLNKDVVYGGAIPESVKQRWEELGMNPDGEDDVKTFLERSNPSLLPSYELELITQKIEDKFEKHKILANNAPAAPEPEKPKAPKI